MKEKIKNGMYPIIGMSISFGLAYLATITDVFGISIWEAMASFSIGVVSFVFLIKFLLEN